MSQDAFTSFQDWRKRRLHTDAPELTDAQAAEFLIQACAQDDDRSIQRIMEEAPQWACSDDLPNDERHPIVACLAMGQKRCFEAFLALTDCALWDFSGGRSLAHFAVELDASWAIEPLLKNGCEIRQKDGLEMSVAAWARVFDDKKASAAFEAHCQEEGLDYEKISGLYAATLSGALRSYFRCFNESERGRQKTDPEFFKRRCEWLAQAGFNPDEDPFLCRLASEAQFVSSESDEFKRAAKEAMALGLSLGCDIEARLDLGGPRPFSALEIAAACLSESMFEALIAAGARRDGLAQPLAQTAWEQFLGGGGHLMSSSLKSGARLSFFKRLCEEDNLWPPFAPDAPALEALFSKPPAAARKKVLLEAFGIWVATGAGQPSPSSSAPRL